MKKIFTGDDGCIRPIFQMILLYAGINVAQVVIIFPIAAVIGIVAGIQAASGNIVDATNIQSLLEGYTFKSLITTVCNMISIFITIILFKVMNKRSKEEMGLTSFKKDYKDLVIGLVLGAASISLITMVLYGIGDMQFKGIYITKDLIIGLIFFITVGLVEEILTRGCFQHIIYYRHGIVWAIIIPSLIFSALHFLNPNISYVAAVNIALVGVIFGLMTYKTGNLWMAIGYHITWNFFQGNIFNIEVSGTQHGTALVAGTRTVDTIFNGGNFGIEGGFICTILLVITLLFFLVFYKKREIK